METLLTPRQVAERLAVSQRTIYLWIEEGRLPAIRLSERVTRISEDVLEAFVRAGTRGAQLAPQESAAYGAAAALVELEAAAPDPTERLRGLLAEHREEILEVAERRRVSNLRVFGSVARGDAGPDSDIDILVDPLPMASLFDLAGLGIELEALLGVKVDIVPARSVKTLIRDRVLDEAVPL